VSTAVALSPDWIAPSRTVVLVVDMQADFASPGGAMARAGLNLSDIPAALDGAARLVATARAAGAAVVFAGLCAELGASAAWAVRAHRLGLASAGPVCSDSDGGGAFVGPRPREGDLVVRKPRYSAFFATDLDHQLKARGVDTLLVVGLTTECCVDSTVRDAFQLDYQVFVVADACAAYERDLHLAALRALELNCAILVDVDDVAKAWRRARA
jgi:ureidoacrylate peracid hydrolase